MDGSFDRGSAKESQIDLNPTEWIMNRKHELTDGGEGTVGDTAADGAGKGEAGVEGSAGRGDSSLGLDGGHGEVRRESGEG